MTIVLAVSLLITGCFNNSQQEKSEKVKKKQKANSKVSKLERGVEKEEEEQLNKVVAPEGVKIKLPGETEVEIYDREEFREEIKDNEELSKLFDIQNQQVKVRGNTATIKGTIGNVFREAFEDLEAESDFFRVNKLKDDAEETSFTIDYSEKWVGFRYSFNLGDAELTKITAAAHRDAQAHFLAYSKKKALIDDIIDEDIEDKLDSIEAISESFETFGGSETDEIEFHGEEEVAKLIAEYEIDYIINSVEIKVEKIDGEWYIKEIDINAGETKL